MVCALMPFLPPCTWPGLLGPNTFSPATQSSVCFSSASRPGRYGCERLVAPSVSGVHSFLPSDRPGWSEQMKHSLLQSPHSQARSISLPE
jgi:hypothetical protein